MLTLIQNVCHELAIAGMLHDIGKLRVAAYLYGRDKDTLGIEEMRYVRMHSRLGYEILMREDYSDFVVESILYHHENYDGSGYPENLVGVPFTLFFATSPDLIHWTHMSADKAFSKERYNGGPWMRYSRGWYYVISVTELPCQRYTNYLFRTKDFEIWEVGYYNPL